MLVAEAEYLQSYLSAIKFIFHILVQDIEILHVSVKNELYLILMSGGLVLKYRSNRII